MFIDMNPTGLLGKVALPASAELVLLELALILIPPAITTESLFATFVILLSLNSRRRWILPIKDGNPKFTVVLIESGVMTGFIECCDIVDVDKTGVG